MENKYKKYFELVGKEWHDHKIGTYHVSAVGNSHADIDPQEHYGPCLRSTYWDYLDPVENDEKSEGNFKMGDFLHEIAEANYKKNHPNSVNEFPIVLKISKDVTIKGSIDIIDFDDKIVLDFKSSSMFTFPSSEYDYNETYLSQVRIYTALLEYWIIKDTYFKPEKLRVVYIKKHNLETVELDILYDWEEVAEAYGDFLERVKYLDNCLRNKKEPEAEPHKWCKFCPRLEKCVEQKDIIEIKKGKYVLND